MRNSRKLDQVDPSLAALHFRNVRLRSPQSFSELDLGHTASTPVANQRGREDGVLGSEQGKGHSGRRAVAAALGLDPISEYPRSGYSLWMDLRSDIRRELELPGDWQYMRAVLPHFEFGETATHVFEGPVLVARGLKVIRHFSEAAVFAFAWEKTFESKSGLMLPVHHHLWTVAEQLSVRFSREAVAAGRDEWTSRRVLVCALLVEGRRRSERWPLEPGYGDYYFDEAQGRASRASRG